MKLRVVIVGRDRNDPLVEAADAYLDRVRRYMTVELHEVKEAPLKKSSDPDRVMAAEAERILEVVPASERLVALDRTGRALDSLQVADRLDSAMQSGIGGLAFVIGGPLGLHGSLLAKAQEKWSLSKLTLPHRLARLLLSEQLYRGFSILRNEPYHK